MATESTAQLALEFGRSVTEMRNYVRQHLQLKIRDNELDISFELLEVLAFLWRKDGINQQELADMAVKDKSSMTYIIDNLAKRDLVLGIEDQDDRRNKRIFLTEKGKLLQKKIYPWVIEAYEKATKKVDA